MPIDYSDLGFPDRPAEGFPANPYFDDDGVSYYCNWCGNASWKLHAPWCKWADEMEGP